MREMDDFEEREKSRKRAGSIGGKHFTAYVDQVKTLRRSAQDAKAASLLLKMVDAVEAEALESVGIDWCIPPWCYEQLALIYRKSKEFTLEVGILERYVAQCEAVRQSPFPNIVDRLQKAKLLRIKHAGN